MTALTVCGPVPAAAPPDLRDAKVTLEVLAIEELADHHAQGQPGGEYLAFL